MILVHHLNGIIQRRTKSSRQLFVKDPTHTAVCQCIKLATEGFSNMGLEPFNLDQGSFPHSRFKHGLKHSNISSSFNKRTPRFYEAFSLLQQHIKQDRICPRSCNSTLGKSKLKSRNNNKKGIKAILWVGDHYLRERKSRFEN